MVKCHFNVSFFLMTYNVNYSIINKGDNMFNQISKNEFNEFSCNSQMGTFFQSTYWGELKSSTGWKHFYVGYKKEGKLVAASLLLAKKVPIVGYMFYSPRGFLIDYNDSKLLAEFILEIKKFVKKNKGFLIKINPYLEYQKRDINGDIVGEHNNEDIINKLEQLGFKHNGLTVTYGKDLEPRWISVLDVKNKTEKNIVDEMRRTTRSSINAADKYGLKLVEIKRDKLNEFKLLMDSTGERRGFVNRPLSYYEKMFDSFEENIKVMLVELDLDACLLKLQNTIDDLVVEKEKLININKDRDKGKINEIDKQLKASNKKKNEINELIENNVTKSKTITIAGGLFMTFGKQVVSLFGASYEEYMKYRAQSFLNFEMIKFAIENKYDKYNFYGITGDFSESSPMFGLFDFKRGFNSNVVELIGEFNCILDYKKFKLYKRIKKIYFNLKRN